VDWRALRARCKAWARRPTNAALLVWLAFVAAGVAFVFLLMTGALNSAVPDASRRRRWTEVANQLLNALFTIMCVYQHPRLCHHLVLLFRSRDADVAELRGVYCKNAAGPQRERLHVAVVLLLLHATCFAQYAYCALFWVFSSQTRPDWAVNMCMALGLGFPVAAAVYMVYGPLGKKLLVLPASTDDEEVAAAAVLEESTATSQHDNGGSRRVAVTKPEWAGGLFDLADDPTVAALSLTCTFCVFGWNMERLGLGNMCVHVFTFALLCGAPVLVFAVAAINIHDAALGSLVGAAGAVLSVLGLLYGGFWRAQMRRRLGLPGDRSVCGGRPATADYVKWLLCAPCALAQEVRTGNLYDVDVEEGNLKLYVRNSDEDLSSDEKPAMAPLERESCVAPLTASKGSDGVECSAAVDAPPVLVMVAVS
jgi:Cys-rich protein (TIGR01571 family)